MIKKWIFLPLALALLAGCKSQQAYTEIASVETDYSHVETTPPKEEKTNEKVIVKEEEVKLTHGAALMRYCIILGSFVNEQYALNLQKQLIDKGFEDACIMQNQQGMFRVAAACYEKEQAARERLLQIRRQYDKYHDAWLLITKQP